MIPILAFKPPVIAHRGAGGDAPENTLAAIRSAHAQGAKWIEVDIKITYDGVPILMHDDTLDRTTSGRGPVADKSWDEVRQLRVGGAGETVPSLSDVMKEVVNLNMSLIAELKPCPGRSKATTMVSIIEMAKNWPESHDHLPVIASFDMESLEIAAQLEPHWPRCLLFQGWGPNWREKASKAGACCLSFPEADLTLERVEEIARLRIPLLAYTVDNAERAKELLAWGVSAVYADRPRAILEQI